MNESEYTSKSLVSDIMTAANMQEMSVNEEPPQWSQCRKIELSIDEYNEVMRKFKFTMKKQYKCVIIEKIHNVRAKYCLTIRRLDRWLWRMGLRWKMGLRSYFMEQI